MSPRDAPAWLGAFQEAFGAVIQTPLDRSTGSLRAETEHYDLSVGATDGPRASARDRLAVYHRQYWFRLFGVMQSSFPLTARLLGFWHFNEFAAAFLSLHPPSSWDIAKTGDGFAAFLGTTLVDRTVRVGSPLRDVAGEMVIAAAALDEAFRAAFHAPVEPSFRPGPEDAARLPTSRLRPSSSALLVEERWALARARQEAMNRGDEAEILPPPPHDQPVSWAVFRVRGVVSQARLSTLEARLWRLLREEPLGRALGQLEGTCDEAERAALPATTQTFLQRSVELSFWTGLDPAELTSGERRSSRCRC